MIARNRRNRAESEKKPSVFSSRSRPSSSGGFPGCSEDCYELSCLSEQTLQFHRTHNTAISEHLKPKHGFICLFHNNTDLRDELSL